jgi:hypothetical protein
MLDGLCVRRDYARVSTRVFAAVGTGMALATVWGGSSAIADGVSNVSRSPLVAACSLLTDSQVAHALAMKVQTKTADPGAGDVIPGSECVWQSVPFGRFTSASAGLDIDIAHVPCTQFQRAFNNARKAGHEVLPYKGIGEIAYLEPDGNGSYALSVCAHGVVVQTSAWRVDSPLATEKSLTAVVLHQLDAEAHL